MPKVAKPKPLTTLQMRFLDDLYAHPDDPQGVVYARHYRASGKAATVNASRLIRSAAAAAYLDTKRQATAERNGITEDEIVQRLWQLADFDIAKIVNEHGDMKPLDEIPADHRRAITSITPVQGGMLKLTFANRESCLARVAEMLGYGAKHKQDNNEISMVRELFKFVAANGQTGVPGTLRFDMSLAARSNFDTDG